MLAQVGSASVAGVESHAVSVEVNISVGLPSFVIVGLPHGAVREGRERVTAALSNVGHPVPHRRITVNLAPADMPKEGSAFDLPIAVAVLVAMGVVRQESVDGLCLVGELGLDGRLRAIRGALPIAAGCTARGVGKLLLPQANAPRGRRGQRRGSAGRRDPRRGSGAPCRGQDDRAYATRHAPPARASSDSATRFERRTRAAIREAGARDCGGGGAQPPLDRSSGCRQNDDCAETPRNSSPAHSG